MSYVVAGGTKGAPWQGDDGIITEAAGDTSNNDNAGFKGIAQIILGFSDTLTSRIAVLIRGLNEAFVRNQDDWDFQVLIHSYIDVQVCSSSSVHYLRS